MQGDLLVEIVKMAMLGSLISAALPKWHDIDLVLSNVNLGMCCAPIGWWDDRTLLMPLR